MIEIRQRVRHIHHLGLQGRPLGSGEPAKGVVESLRRKLWVQPRQRILQARFKHDLPVVGALSGKFARRDLGAVLHYPAKAF